MKNKKDQSNSSTSAPTAVPDEEGKAQGEKPATDAQASGMAQAHMYAALNYQ